MSSLLRWGRSAYETDLDLVDEQHSAEALGFTWSSVEERRLPGELQDADVLVVNSGVRVSEDALGALRGDLVITTTSGTDHIDLAAAAARGIAVCRCPMARRDAVVETTLAGLLGLMREVPRLHAASARGEWARGRLPTLGPALLADQTVAVVGAGGVIGREVCRRLGALGVSMVGVDPAGVPDGIPSHTLHDALEQADALTLHCHLTEQTRSLIDGQALDTLGTGIVINTARGGVLDLDDAVARVADGRLRGLLTDVYPTEPWPPLAHHAQVEGLWLLPHAAGFTPDLGRRVTEGVALVLRARTEGRPLPHRVA